MWVTWAEEDEKECSHYFSKSVQLSIQQLFLLPLFKIVQRFLLLCCRNSSLLWRHHCCCNLLLLLFCSFKKNYKKKLLFCSFESFFFYTSVSWWFSTGVWVTASLLKFLGLLLVFWPQCSSLDGLYSSSYFQVL